MCFIFTCLLVHIFTCLFRIVSAVLTVFLMCFNLAYATKLLKNVHHQGNKNRTVTKDTDMTFPALVDGVVDASVHVLGPIVAA